MSPGTTGAVPGAGRGAAVDPVLALDDLRVGFPTARGEARAVRGVSWSVRPRETLAVVGESGSGKSVSTLAVLGLLPPHARVAGSVRFRDRELVGADEATLRAVRGAGIGMVFQDPSTSLDAVLTVGRQVTEGMEVHLGLRGAAARRRAADLLGRVGLPDPEGTLERYPHELSGGMRQRVMIAIALACDPAVLVADEPTTALDVTTQAQIVELVASLQEERDMAVVWVSHDLGVVAGLADRVVVMYAGRVVEDADALDLYDDPRHPYTAGLLASIPSLDPGGPARLPTVAGQPPDPLEVPVGCAFAPRCPVRAEACVARQPPLEAVPGAGSGRVPHLVATQCAPVLAEQAS